MKAFGWTVLTVGLLGCIWAGFVGSMSLGNENTGFNVIGIAIAAVGVVYAGVKLIQQSDSRA
jgi:hypothetical protein